MYISEKIRKIQKVLKRALCFVLVLVLTAPVITESSLPAAAHDHLYFELEADRLPADELPDGNIVYFGTPAATLDESNRYYAVKVYREGDISSSASVELHTVDMTAVYGEDYQLVMAGISEFPSGKNILKTYIDAVKTAEKAVSDENVQTKQNEAEAQNAVLNTESNEKSALAQLKEDATGEPTRETYPSETMDVVQAMVEGMIPSAVGELEHSSCATLSFDAGEDEKTVLFRLKDDDISEGDENFSIVLANAVGCEVHEVPSISVIIKDNEPVVRSVISFTKTAFDSDGDTVTLEIEREKAEYSLVDMRIFTSENTAQAGVNYEALDTTLSFMPYETKKTVKMNIAGEGDFSVRLSDFTACDGGQTVSTKVNIVKENNAPATLTSTSTKSFTIDLDNRTYTVEYNEGEPTGKIIDKAYTPPLEVGCYYFALPSDKGGYFHYSSDQFSGDRPNGLGTLDCEYVTATEQHDSYGDVAYYHSTTWKNGKIWTYGDVVMPGVYYQYVAADIASTSSFGGGQKFRLNSTTLGMASYTGGKFDRNATSASIKIVNIGNTDYNKMFHVSLDSIDDSSTKTPKSYLRFYGVAAMYKKYVVSVSDPVQMSYLTGNTVNGEAEMSMFTPVQVTVKCGALPTVGVGTERDIYANPDSAQSNLVFNIGEVKLNGSYGKFGVLKGYKIRIGDGEGAITVSYPDDLLNFIEGRSGTTGKCADYSSTAIDKQKKKILDSLGTVPYDAYFIDWIDSLQKKVYNSETGIGYYQKLSFTPVFDYEDVQVTVLEPLGGLDAAFINGDVSTTGTYTFHAGDVLDLSAVSNEEHYSIVGYEYSLDGGSHYYTVPDSTLQLLPQKASGYYIRPLLAENDNRIEIEFKDGAEDHFEITGINYQGLIDDDLLKNNGLGGRYILNVNGGGKNLAEIMNPSVGELYSINFASLKDDGEYVYIPVITDNMTGNVYRTKRFDFESRSNKEDNLLTVGYEKVLKSEMVKFSVSGTVVTNYAPLVSTGLENTRNPVANYTVTLPGIQKEMTVQVLDISGNVVSTKTMQGITSVNALTDENGTFKAGTLSGEDHIYGRTNDRITMIISNGSDAQKFDVVLGGTVSDGTASTQLSELYIRYPDDAPRINSITYRYDKAANNNETDELDNSIKIFDDTVRFTAIASNIFNSETKRIKALDFKLYDPSGNCTATFNVPNPDETLQGGIFTLIIENMNQVLQNGERLRLSVIEEKYKPDGSAYTVTYPEIDTGYVFYIENTLLLPKSYDIPESQPVDIPIIGTSQANASTGLLSFSKTEWPTDDVGRITGYTLSVNAGALGNTVSLGSKEKVEKFIALEAAAKEAQNNLNNVGHTKKEIEQSALACLEAISKATTEEEKTRLQKELQSLERQKDIFEEYAPEMKKSAKQPLTGFSKVRTLQAEALFVLTFSFIYDPVRGEYVLSCGTVLVAGSFDYSRSFYTVIYGVPVFLNLSGSLQVDLLVSYPTKSGQEALTEGEFNDYSGNLKDMLTEAKAVATITTSFMAQAGAGMCNVLSARGYAKFGMQFAEPIGEHPEDEGLLLMASGGIGFDLLVLSINFDIGNLKYGFGIYENETDISFLGGNIPLETVNEKSLRASAKNTDGQTSVSLNDYTVGTSDMSMFGYNGFIRATPEEVSRTVLLDDAAERTRPKMILLEDGRRMLFFIGNRGTENGLNNMALFCSVYENGMWSAPKIVCDDGTVDTNPTVAYKNGKAVITWVDANKKFTAEDTNFDKLNSFGISMAIYENGEFSDEITLVDDEFFNFAPQLNIVDDKLYCSYMKRDISDVKTEEGLLDLTATYSTMAYVRCDIPSRTVDEEKFVVIKHPFITDPLVFDYKCMTANSNGRNYMLSTYTVDEDGNLNTNEDRELFLMMTDLDSDVSYYPVQITNDSISQSTPHLTDINGVVYLTWIENGGIFNILDVSDMLETLFGAENEVSEVFRQCAEDGDAEWYRKTADELGMNSEDYERTLYEKLYNRRIISEKENLQADESAMLSISDYRLVTSGDDIYIFYTAAGTKEGDTGIELFGARYKRDVTENDTADADIDDTSVFEEWGFGKSVQITDYGKVIDEFDIIMTQDDDIFAVSNHYDHWIDDNGNMCYGENRLVEIEFKPKGSIGIKNDEIKLPSNLAKGDVENIVFTVENDGLISTEGFDYSVSVVKNGVETVIQSESLDIKLDTAETYTLTVPWTIPDDVSDTSVKVTVNERDVDIPNPDTVTEDVIFASAVIITDTRITCTDGEYFVHAEVENIGNKASTAVKGTLSAVENASAVKTYSEFDIPALQSGEVAEFVIPLSPSVDDFNQLGFIELELSVLEGERKHSSKALNFVPGAPVCAEINGGAEAVTLCTGMSFGVSTKTAPWGELAGDVVYLTDDPAVATVDENGVITANGKGTTTLRVYYPKNGISDTMQINVDADPDAPAPVYTVLVKGCEHGTVSVDKQACEENGIVTVTPIPDTGYITENVTVTDENGNVVPVTANNDGTYSFVQPPHNVIIEAAFALDGGADNPQTVDLTALIATVAVISYAATVILNKKAKRT